MIGASAWGKLADNSQKVVGIDFRMYYNMILSLSLTLTKDAYKNILCVWVPLHKSLFMMEDNINIAASSHSSSYSNFLQ